MSLGVVNMHYFLIGTFIFMLMKFVDRFKYFEEGEIYSGVSVATIIKSRSFADNPAFFSVDFATFSTRSAVLSFSAHHRLSLIVRLSTNHVSTSSPNNSLKYEFGKVFSGT